MQDHFSNKGALVSIAVPCYNQELVLAETLSSLVDQDYENLEIVVSDDASTDGTADIAHDFALRFPGRVIFRRQRKNLGPTENVRAMSPLLRGDYICWFAGDDICLPGKVSKQVAAITAEPDAVACYHDVDVFDGMTGRSLYRYNEPGLGHTPYAGHIVRELLLHRCFIGAISIMVRKDVAHKVRHVSELARISDWLYFIDVAYCGKVVYLPEVLARYRRHKDNITRTVDITDELRTYEIVKEKYPEYTREADLGLLRLKVAYCLRYASVGQFGKALGLAAELCQHAALHPSDAAQIVKHILFLARQRAYLLIGTGKVGR